MLIQDIKEKKSRIKDKSKLIFDLTPDIILSSSLIPEEYTLDQFNLKMANSTSSFESEVNKINNTICNEKIKELRLLR